MTNEKQVIIDLVNKIKYEVTPELLAELSGHAKPLSGSEFVDWHARIDGLKLTGGDCRWISAERAAQLRAFLHGVLGVTHKIGGRVVHVGKRVVKWIMSLLDRFPATLMAAVVMAALCFVIASIPYLGPVLLPVAKLASAWVVGIVVFGESLRGLSAGIRVSR